MSYQMFAGKDRSLPYEAQLLHSGKLRLYSQTLDYAEKA
jgi:hypothetical protein